MPEEVVEVEGVGKGDDDKQKDDDRGKRVKRGTNERRQKKEKGGFQLA